MCTVVPSFVPPPRYGCSAAPQIADFFSRLLQACKTIANLVDRATITGMVGYEGGGGSVNVQVPSAPTSYGIATYERASARVLLEGRIEAL